MDLDLDFSSPTPTYLITCYLLLTWTAKETTLPKYILSFYPLLFQGSLLNTQLP